MTTATKTKARKPEMKKPEVETLQLPPGVLPGKEAILAGAVQQIRLDKIDIVGKGDRESMTDADLKIPELAQSIATAGLQQPIRVVPHNNDRYALVFGERRVRACRLLGHERISAVVVPQEAMSADTDRSVSEARAVENIQRVDPSPIGEATAIADLFDINMADVLNDWRNAAESLDASVSPSVSRMAGLRAEAIRRTAERVGKPETWVRDRMFLSGFSGNARDLVSSGRLPLMHAKEIAKVADPKRRDELAEEYAICSPGKGNYYRYGEGQPGQIEDLRAEVAKSLYSLGQVPWNLAQPFDGKPACEECPHNSGNNPGLFEGKVLFGDDPKHANKIGRYGGPDERAIPKDGICLKPSCYQEKTTAASRAISGVATKALNKFEAAKAAKEKNAANLIGLGEIKLLAPNFVSPFVVKERIDARIEARKTKKPAGTTASASPARRAGDYGTPEYDAKQRGENLYRKAEHDWVDKKATPALAKYLAEVPGRWAMFVLVRCSKAFEKAAGYNAKPKDWETPELTRLVRLVEVPSLANTIEIQKHCGVTFGLFRGGDDCGYESPAFMEWILKTLGVSVPPAPIEKTFIDAELAKLKKTAAPAKGGKKPAAKKRTTGAENGDVREDGE